MDVPVTDWKSGRKGKKAGRAERRRGEGFRSPRASEVNAAAERWKAKYGASGGKGINITL